MGNSASNRPRAARPGSQMPCHDLRSRQWLRGRRTRMISAAALLPIPSFAVGNPQDALVHAFARAQPIIAVQQSHVRRAYPLLPDTIEVLNFICCPRQPIQILDADAARPRRSVMALGPT